MTLDYLSSLEEIKSCRSASQSKLQAAVERKEKRFKHSGEMRNQFEPSF
jgi:hypothetical protein